MQKQENGDVLLSALEVNSLARVLESVSNLLAQLPSSGDDLLGDADDYIALCLWKDVLTGHEYDLSHYMDEGEEDVVKTVAEWLAAHGEEE